MTAIGVRKGGEVLLSGVVWPVLEIIVAAGLTHWTPLSVAVHHAMKHFMCR